MHRSLRAQAALDAAASLLIAILAWPFPLARATLSVPVHAVSILVVWWIVQIAYYTVTVGFWGQTGGMRLLGLGLAATAPRPVSGRQRALWGAMAGVAGFAVPFDAKGRVAAAIERRSGLRVVRVATVP